MAGFPVHEFNATASESCSEFLNTVRFPTRHLSTRICMQTYGCFMSDILLLFRVLYTTRLSIYKYLFLPSMQKREKKYEGNTHRFIQKTCVVAVAVPILSGLLSRSFRTAVLEGFLFPGDLSATYRIFRKFRVHKFCLSVGDAVCVAFRVRCA